MEEKNVVAIKWEEVVVTAGNGEEFIREEHAFPLTCPAWKMAQDEIPPHCMGANKEDNCLFHVGVLDSGLAYCKWTKEDYNL